MQASGSVDPGSNPSWGVIFLQKLSGKSEQDFGILRKVVNSYFKKILDYLYVVVISRESYSHFVCVYEV